MARLTKDELEDLKSTVDIVDVVSADVSFDRKKSQQAKGDMWFCCPVHGEKNPSAHVRRSHQDWKCFGCGAGGDVLSWLKDVRGLTFVQALDFLGAPNRELTPEEKRAYAQKRAGLEQKRREQEAQAETDRQETVANVMAIWKSCRKIAGTEAAAYLKGRHLGFEDWPPSLRFHPGLWCKPVGRNAPALVAGVQAADRSLIAIWRIFLDGNGGALLDENGKKIKLGFGPSSGGMVRLSHMQSVLNVGEGLESTIGAMKIDGGDWGWGATLSTSGMVGLDFPEGVKRIDIWADGDPYRFHPEQDKIVAAPGEAAARSLQQKAQQGGLLSQCHVPPEGSDWADIHATSQAVA